jgi:hypothetical protein
MPGSTKSWISLKLCGLLLTGSAIAQQKTPLPPEFAAWLPVMDSERSLKAAAVEKDAGAEILLWRVRVVDEFQGQRPAKSSLQLYSRESVRREG